jgi:ATPase subunit of ABC transporter with duplicated ATPase domains
MVVISHDRHFLNSVVTNILDVDFKKIREFSGNYDDWYISSTLIQKQQEMDRDKKLKEKADLEGFIRRFSANASKAKQATSRQKQLEKLNINELQTSSRRDPSIVFRKKRDIGNEVLNVENLSFSYGEQEVLKNISFKVEKGDKIALIGSNGIGKSTLCKLLISEIFAKNGTIHWGATIEASYFPQDTTDIIKGDIQLFEWLQQFDDKKDLDEIRKCLGRMLFSGEEQKKSIKSISGGEKHRMMLSKLMLERGNFLILDEPNNHLDLEAIIALGEALYNFDGVVICITHDRELIDAFANRIIKIDDNGKLVDFKGDYEAYKEQESI